MSDSPNSSQPPNSSNRPSGDAGGFNWRFFILALGAAAVFGLALFGPNMSQTSRTLSYSQFRQAWDQGRIITDDAKRPLKVVTTDTAYDASITGWEMPAMQMPKEPIKQRSNFRVVLNLDLQGKQVQQILGEDIRMETLPADAVEPGGESVQTISIADLRKAKALGEIQVNDLQNPLRILAKPDSREAVVVGAREVITNMVSPVDASGKALEATPFSVTVSIPILADDL
ncbi:MAG: hypothetical protein RIR37_335, partial [Verrucomicrobiota bacterium]